MTQSLFYIGQLIDTLETINRHNGQHMTRIVTEENYQPLRGRINEMIDHGLAVKRVGISGYAGRIYISHKGLDVLELLKEAQRRIEDDLGSDVFYYNAPEQDDD